MFLEQKQLSVLPNKCARKILVRDSYDTHCYPKTHIDPVVTIGSPPATPPGHVTASAQAIVNGSGNPATTAKKLHRVVHKVIDMPL